MSKHEKYVVEFVRRNRAALESRPSALFSVSLAALGDTAEAEGYVATFEEQTGWHPTMVALVGGALLYRHYGFVKRRVMRRIAHAKPGQLSTDISRDHVYTDWDGVRRFVEDFLAAAFPGDGASRRRHRASASASASCATAQLRSSPSTTSGGASRMRGAVGLLDQHAAGQQPLADARVRPSRPGSTSTPAHRPRAAHRHEAAADQRAQPRVAAGGQLARPPLVAPRSPSSRTTARPDGGGQRVAAERGAVAARAQHAEHVLGGHHRRHRHDPAAERLAQHVDVGDHALEVAGERRARSVPGPDWISSATNSTSVAVHSLADAGQVAGRGHDHPGLALDRLEQHRDGVVVDRRPGARRGRRTGRSGSRG